VRREGKRQRQREAGGGTGEGWKAEAVGHLGTGKIERSFAGKTAECSTLDNGNFSAKRMQRKFEKRA
jgi:hypothetical protein